MTNLEIYAKEILSRVERHEIVGAEIGVYRGDLSSLLLRDPRVAHLDMIDSWLPADEQPEAYRATGDFHAKFTAQDQEANLLAAERATDFADGRRTILRLDSVRAADHVADGSLDFVFLDGDHSREGVAADIKAWRPKVRPGGLLCGHDYGRPGPECAGVKPAVDEAGESNGWSLELGKDYTWFVRL